VIRSFLDKWESNIATSSAATDLGSFGHLLIDRLLDRHANVVSRRNFNVVDFCWSCGIEGDYIWDRELCLDPSYCINIVLL
jgi:hypothetical protein